MLIKPFYKDKLFLSGVIVISLFIITAFILFSYNFCFFEDDYFFGLYHKNEKLFDCLRFDFKHGGGYIGYFLSKFIPFYLPNIFHIHPADFSWKYASSLRAVFAVITFLLISRFSDFFYKSKPIFFLTFLFTALYFFYCALFNNTFIITVNYNFYRYFFSLIFFCIFWNYIFKNIFINYKKINKIHLFLICICAYIIGTSSEIVFFVSLLLSVLIFIYKFFNKRICLNKTFYIPVVILALTVILFVTSSGFHDVSLQRGLGTFHINKEFFISFTAEYFKIYIKNLRVYWLIFIFISSFSLHYAIKKNEIEKILLPLFMQVSILTVIFSLIFCGTTYYIEGMTWLSHERIIFVYSIMILIPLYLNLSYLIKSLIFNNKADRCKIIKYTSFLLCIACISVIILLINITVQVKSFYNKNYEFKKNVYILEKIFRFYRLKKEIPYIPFDIKDRSIYLYKPAEKEECIIDYNYFITSYYPNIYKDKDVDNFYCLSDKSIERFEQKGGNISNEELKNLNFSKLLDDNFVLNKKI